MSTKPLALVTGASRGLGAAIAEKLAASGFTVALNFASNEAKAAELKAKIEGAGGSAVLAKFDVADSAAVDAAIESLTAAHGPVACLVANAGITIDSLLMRLKDEDLDRTLDVDLKGAIYCVRAASRGMMKARAGSVILISSVVGEMGNAGQTAYAAAKAGLIGFGKSLAKELASRSIRCNIVTPGYIQTDMTGALTEAQKDAILRSIPLGSLGSPDDVAEMVSFLASPRARYVTGQVIGVNGGMYI
ncbi:MAG: 3-oxoacyl-[acyl-carrier-protein] reductase [Bdellovibrionales bacterium]|nr:3-oxoacyl-[acyl-carrier-protein] reductase [Bdellovibrionales bacterium]